MPIQRGLSLAAAVFFATAILAAEPAGTPPTNSTQATAEDCPPIDAVTEPVPQGAGLRAFIDPATGRPREPHPSELAAIAESSRLSNNESIEGLVVEILPDGTKLLDLQGRFMHALVATRNAEGVTTFTCTARDAHTHPHQTPPPGPSSRAEE